MEECRIGCAYLSGSELALVDEGFIRIRDGRIVGLSPVEPPSDTESCRTLLYPDCIAIPGLINAHAHLRDAIAAEAAVGSRLEASVMGPNSIRARRMAEASPAERISAVRQDLIHMAGLGTSAVADFCDGGVDGVREVRAAAAGVPIDVVVLGRLRTPQTPDSVKADERLSPSQIAELEGLLEIADGFATATVNDYGDRAWEEIRARARRAGKLLAVHLAEDAGQRLRSLELTGQTDFERVIALAPDHVVHLTEIAPAGMDAILANGVPAVMCPRSNAMLGIGHPPLLELLDRNHVVALGTDNLMINGPNLWREMEYAAKSYRALRRDADALKPGRLLQCATAHAAKVLRVDGELGAIEVGKRADLVLVKRPRGSVGVEMAAHLEHRLEPWDIVGRFYRGRWTTSTSTHSAADPA